MKSLKFTPELAQQIRSGEKTTTWRLFDDKGLQTGDEVELVARPDMKVIATARLDAVVEKAFKDITAADRKDHPREGSAEEEYEAFSQMYGQPVGPETRVKIIAFSIKELR